MMMWLLPLLAFVAGLCFRKGVFYARKIIRIINNDGFMSLLRKVRLKLNKAPSQIEIPPKSSHFDGIELPQHWKTSFEDRYKKIKEKSKEKCVVYIDVEPQSNTSRYRVYNTCQALEQSQEWVATYFFADELDKIRDLVSLVNLIIFVRTPWSFQMEAFVQHVKNAKVPLAYDIDDLIFDINRTPLLLDTIAAPVESYEFWFSHAARTGLFIEMFDYTIGTNDFICDQLEKKFAKKSYKISNFLNHEQLDFSRPLYERKQQSKDQSTFKLGYFSGSISHKKDFDLIADEIAQFLDNHAEVTLEIVGYMELPAVLQKYIPSQRVFHSPFVNFLELQKKISQVDVNLAPLLENDFTHCKSELKFFEAAIAGTITCASPSYAFKTSIQHEKTGYLCRAGEWLETLEKIYQNKKPLDMLEKAREYSLQMYSPKYQCIQIENTFNSILYQT